MNDSTEQGNSPEAPGVRRKSLAKKLTDQGRQLPESFNDRDPSHIKLASQLYDMTCELIQALPGGKYFDRAKWSPVRGTNPLWWMDKFRESPEYCEFKIRLKNDQNEELDISLKTGDILGEELEMHKISNSDSSQLYLNLTDALANHDYLGRGWHRNKGSFREFNENGTIDNYRDRTFENRPPQPTVNVAQIIEQIVSA